MPSCLKPLPMLALLAWAAPLAAQEAEPAPADVPAAAAPTPAEDQPAEAPEAGATATGTLPELDMSQGAQAGSAEPQVGEAYLREEFGDWAQRCVRSDDGNDPCDLFQLLTDAEGNVVSEIGLFPLPNDQQAAAGAIVVVPHMTLLTEGISISVDGGAPWQYPIRFCNASACVARIGFTAEEVQAFKRGNAAQLTIVDERDPQTPVAVTISLAGFTAGYDALMAGGAAQPAE